VWYGRHEKKRRRGKELQREKGGANKKSLLNNICGSQRITSHKRTGERITNTSDVSPLTSFWAKKKSHVKSYPEIRTVGLRDPGHQKRQKLRQVIPSNKRKKSTSRKRQKSKAKYGRGGTSGQKLRKWFE